MEWAVHGGTKVTHEKSRTQVGQEDNKLGIRGPGKVWVNEEDRS